jgi:multidrug efflux system membrane fusion protein
VQRGPNGTFVFVVESDNRVAVRSVTVTEQDETQAVIVRGLGADERVVTTGFARLTAGSEVAVTDAASAPSPDALPTERRRGGPDRRERRSDAGPSASR